MITECGNCSGKAADLCTQAYKVSAQKIAGSAGDLVISGASPEFALRVIAKTRDRELATLTYLSGAVLPACNLSPKEVELRLDEAIIEAGDTLSTS